MARICCGICFSSNITFSEESREEVKDINIFKTNFHCNSCGADGESIENWFKPKLEVK